MNSSLSSLPVMPPSRRVPYPIRVLSVPEGHVYVRHLSHPQGEHRVRRLPDPLVPGDVPAAQWWPPPALEVDWVRRHADEFDVFHLHFGFDARTPAQLADLVAALRETGTPLVYTVHDLRNPHHASPALHDAQLDVLVPAADELITLTEGAATQIAKRWGRQATVLPHPHVVDEATLARPRPPRGHEADYVVGVHLKSLRASMDPIPVLSVLLAEVSVMPDVRLTANVHTDVMTPGFDNYDPDAADLLRRSEAEGLLELSVHDFLPDDALWDYLQALDLSVLPYRFGTHSGWLEACHDLGTAVLAPDCGFYSDQRPCLTYHLDESGLDQESLRSALQLATAQRPAWRADPSVRREERIAVAEAHHALYLRALSR